MQHHRNKPILFVAVSALLSALAASPALAQQAPSSAGRAATRPAAEVLAQIGRSAGVIVLADSTIHARLPVPTVAATPETVEQQIATMVSALPPGTTWAKLYVPAPTNGPWRADTVADYARSLARMVGTVGRAAPAGTVEILGRHVPADKANEYITALNLKLVYLVTNPRGQATSSTAANWEQMTPEQRDQFAQQQAQRILALDPETRIQALRQMMQEATPHQAIMKTVISQMTDAERIQLKTSLAGESKDGLKIKVAR